MIAVFGDPPLGVAGELGVALERVEDRRLVDDGVLPQDEDLLEVGREAARQIHQEGARHVAPPQDGLDQQRVLRLGGEEGEHLLARLALQKRRDDARIDLPQRLHGAPGDLRIDAAGQLHLQRDELLRRERQEPGGRQDLQLAVGARPDVLEQRALALGHGSAGLSLFAQRPHGLEIDDELHDLAGGLVELEGIAVDLDVRGRRVPELHRDALLGLELQRLALDPLLLDRRLAVDITRTQQSPVEVEGDLERRLRSLRRDGRRRRRRLGGGLGRDDLAAADRRRGLVRPLVDQPGDERHEGEEERAGQQQEEPPGPARAPSSVRFLSIAIRVASPG